MNPALWLARSAKRAPMAQALFHGTQQVATYGEFAAQAASVAGALAERGIGKGDRVAIFMSNSPDYLVVMYGIWFAGAVAVPINGKLHIREAAWIMDNAEASLAFISDDIAHDLACVMTRESCALVSVNDQAFAAMKEASPLPAPVSLDRDDMAWLFYTSGTTGTPKGVMMSCGNISAMVMGYFIEVDDVETTDSILYAAPMSHGAGIYNFMFVMRGCRHVVPLSGGFDAHEILELAPQIGNIAMFAAPTMVRRLVDVAKHTGQTGEGLKTIVYAGGPMYLADILDAVEVMGPRFVQIYGQGECPMAITALGRADVTDRAHPRAMERLASVGLAQCMVEVRIVDEKGKGLPNGEIGEIVVKGSPVMLGYWRNPEATVQTLRDGWLWTGDMGFMDDDGYITMQDRSKDMIISGGSNVYPREVEEVLLTHEEVREVAVVGQVDEEWGELVVAFVVTTADSKLDDKALDHLCLDNIARFKRPKFYHFVDELPKNNYGKVLKTELRERLVAMAGEE
ncbi:MAG: AMP-binding protein [Cohaesibacter sp.]|jgi:long-chain acyl-CoA synthetase|nr:AMP-binding protein [Cohaesibacter sp.]